MPQTRLKLKQVAVALAGLPLAVGIALAKDTPEAKKGVTEAELKYQAGTSPLAGVEMHQNINPKAPPMTAAEFSKGRQIYFERRAGCHGVLRKGIPSGQVVNLDVRRKVADLPLPGLPHLGSGISWSYQDRPVMATPNLKEGVVSVIDMEDWKVIKEVKTAGAAFFMRSHENTPYAWVDAMMSPAKDTMQLLDKRTLEVAKTLRPEPGKIAAHTEFTRDGKYALVSIWENDGALVIYDAETLKEVKRLPMRKPVGKYNVYNKITRSEGTSH